MRRNRPEDSEVAVIRQMRAGGIGRKHVAAKYGISKSQVTRICLGHSRGGL